MRTTILLLVLASACASTSAGIKPYVRPSLTLQGTQEEILDALVLSLRMQRMDIIRADRSKGMIEAVSPVELISDVPWRARWHFVVDQGEVRMQRWFEVELDEGEWETADEVCEGYQYLAERRQMDMVLDQLGQVAMGKQKVMLAKATP